MGVVKVCREVCGKLTFLFFQYCDGGAFLRCSLPLVDGKRNLPEVASPWRRVLGVVFPGGVQQETRLSHGQTTAVTFDLQYRVAHLVSPRFHHGRNVNIGNHLDISYGVRW